MENLSGGKKNAGQFSGTPPDREVKKSDLLGDVNSTRNFFNRVNNFPDTAQSYIAGLSSTLLEEDIFNKLRRDKAAIGDIANDLKAVGLEPNDVKDVLTFFHLHAEIGEGKKIKN